MPKIMHKAIISKYNSGTPVSSIFLNSVMDLLNEAAAQTASEPEKVEKRWFEFNK